MKTCRAELFLMHQSELCILKFASCNRISIEIHIHPRTIRVSLLHLPAVMLFQPSWSIIGTNVISFLDH